MQLIWQKGHFTWIASHPNCTIQASEQFPLSEVPENQAIDALSQKLLQHGGESVVVPFVEENSCAFFAQFILKRRKIHVFVEGEW